MPTISKNLSKKHSSIKKSKRVYRKHTINKTKRLKKSVRKMKGGGQYDFTTKLAQSTLNASKTSEFAHTNPGIRMSSGDRQTIWVNDDLKALFGERNPAGQTLLYCLLRFTMNPYIRTKFLYAATKEQLSAQNTNCGSTALMGYFWGEIENPRMDNSTSTPVSDIFIQFPALLAVAKIANNLGETSLDFAMEVASRRPDDLAKLKKLL